MSYRVLLRYNIAFFVFLTLSLVCFAAQVASPSSSSPLPSDWKEMSLNAALGIATITLWRTGRSEQQAYKAELQTLREKYDERLDAKDTQLLALIKSVSELMIVTVDTNKELRNTVQASIDAKTQLTRAIEHLTTRLANRPCLAENLEAHSAVAD